MQVFCVSVCPEDTVDVSRCGGRDADLTRRGADCRLLQETQVPGHRPGQVWGQHRQCGPAAPRYLSAG